VNGRISVEVAFSLRSAIVCAVLQIGLICRLCLPPLDAAQVVALPAGIADSVAAVATWDNGHGLRILHYDGAQRRFQFTGHARAEALVWCAGCGIVMLGDGDIAALSFAGCTPERTSLGIGPRAVRAAVTVSESRLAVIAGGRYAGNMLQDARPALWEITPKCRKLWNAGSSHINSQFVASGRLNGAESLLVGVHRSAVFDPQPRLRPWIYRLQGAGLVPLWKGTTFSRPYITAAFADVCPESVDDEVCVLELTRAGQRQISVYAWHGFVMEGIARSSPAPYGDTLRSRRGPSPGSDAVYVWKGAEYGWIVGLGAPDCTHGRETMLQVLHASRRIERPLAWDVGQREAEPVAFVLTRHGELVCVPLATCAAKELAGIGRSRL